MKPDPYTDTDYEAVVIPDGKPPEEYTWAERRAEILRMVKAKGSPYALKKTDLADHYGVAPSTITKDFYRLAEYVDEYIGRHSKITARSAMEKAVKELQDEGEWSAAFNVAMQWNRWLQSIGEQERVPASVDITTREADTETDEYVFVEDGASVETAGEIAEADDA